MTYPVKSPRKLIEVALPLDAINAEAVSLYLSFAHNRAVDYGCSLATWRPKDNAMRSGMAKQALPMTWDFAEGNLFGQSSSGFSECIEVVARVISTSLGPPNSIVGYAWQHNVMQVAWSDQSIGAVVSTDPPYYDNIGYADLSDYFYVWLRRSLRSIYSNLFGNYSASRGQGIPGKGQNNLRTLHLTGPFPECRALPE